MAILHPAAYRPVCAFWFATVGLITSTALAPLAAQPPTELPAFKSPEEMVEGWYHRHERESWMARGADPAVLDEILARIESATGPRRDPDLVDTQIEYGPGNWSYEWVQAGDDAFARAQGLLEKGHEELALETLQTALTYYTTGSWPHLGRADDVMALDKAVRTYLAAGALLARPVEHVELRVGGRTARGYLHIPAGAGPFPFVVNTFGSDVTKEDSLGFFVHELEHRGIGMLAVDLPGIGEARQIPLLEGSDAMLLAGADFLRGRPEVNTDALFLVGGSFGGNAAARAFYTAEVAGVVSMCGPLHRPFLAPPEVLDSLPRLTIDGVKARLGLLDRPTAELAEVAPGLSLVEQGRMGSERTVRTPLLVITTNRDPVAPLADLELFLHSATNAKTVILDQIGHCPPRWLREPVIARWIADQLDG